MTLWRIVLDYGSHQEFDDTREGRDVMRLHFVNSEHLHRGDLVGLLKEHLASLNGK